MLATASIAVAACSGGSHTSRGSAPPPSPSGSSAPTSTNISFDADGTTTYGTLEVPAHPSGQKLAAALLIAGSGPTDRNGNDPGLGVTADTLQLIANDLASEGVISLRFDKYFSGQTGGGRFAGDPESITVDDFLQQATSAYNFLRSQRDVDPNKMLIVGHSEGGRYALVLANSLTPRPAGLALLEPADARQLNVLEVQIDEHLNGYVAAGQMTPAEAVDNAHLVQAAIADFRAGRPVSTSGMSPVVAKSLAAEIGPPNTNDTRTEDMIVPAEYAAKLPSSTSVLVTDGTRDTNIPPSTIGPLISALQQARVGGPGYQLLQGTDHYMHLASQPDTEPVLAPAAVAAIKNWAHEFSG